jgi:hypothetical protein
MKRVIYISVPMTGREREAIAGDVERAMEFCRILYADFELRFISPLDLAAELERMTSPPFKGGEKEVRDFRDFGDGRVFKGGAPTYGAYLGYDIAVLIEEADTVCFCGDWQHSDGCQLEWKAAYLYKKEMRMTY